MKTVKIIAYHVDESHHPADDDMYEHPTGGRTTKVFVDLDGVLRYFCVTDSYGSCYSGYTCASWGDISHKLLIWPQEDPLPADTVFAEGDTFIKVNSFYDDDAIMQYSPAVIEQDPECFYDAMLVNLFTTDGQLLAMHTGNGGCTYYSSGQAEFYPDVLKCKVSAYERHEDALWEAFLTQ